MPALSFSIPEHLPKILGGTKTNTIRPIFAGKDCRFYPCGTLYLYWKQRTRSCTKIGESACVDVRFLMPQSPRKVSWDDLVIPPPHRALGLDALARRDGFECWDDLSLTLWRFYSRALLQRKIRAFVSVRWDEFQQDPFAEKRLAELGLLEGS